VVAEVLRALPLAVLAATVPGYFWARCLFPSGDRVAMLAYSTALSMALVPAAALVQTRVLGTGVTLPVAEISMAAVLVGGLLVYLRFGPAEGDEPPPEGPPAAWRGYALAAVLVTTVVLVLLRGYWGPVRHDWPFIRGGDQYSHAVMSGLMMAEGRIDSYLIYPPGFHTMTAVISRLSGLEPLELFPILAPALLLLPPLACYALAAGLWGRAYGVAAAFLCGVLLTGPYESFAEARYPNLLSADFLIVMAVAAMILVYSSPGVRSGLLLAILGSAVVLYHQVGSFYLALLLALVAFLFLPYLLLAGHRKGATALLLSLAALGLLSLFYAWDTYDIGRLAVGLLGGSDTGAGGTAVAIAIGSQEPLTLGHLLRTTSQPVAWLGLFGALLVASEILRKRAGTPRALAYLTVLLWALLLFAGSRTSYSGFPQRFERDLGIPLAVLAALALVEILRLARPSRSPQAPLATRLVAALAAALAVVVVGVYGAQNVKDAGRPSANVVSEEVAAAGGWLAEHNTGGNIVVTPYLNDHVPGSAMLAMGGYTGLRSYTRERLRTPRALPPSGKEPLLAADRITHHPVGARTEALLDRYDIRYVALFKGYPAVSWRAFDRAPEAYEKVFENGAVAVFAPRERPAPAD
jgi:hypothetical protein